MGSHRTAATKFEDGTSVGERATRSNPKPDGSHRLPPRIGTVLHSADMAARGGWIEVKSWVKLQTT